MVQVQATCVNTNSSFIGPNKFNVKICVNAAARPVVADNPAMPLVSWAN